MEGQEQEDSPLKDTAAEYDTYDTAEQNDAGK